jgi:hypothetical protein
MQRWTDQLQKEVDLLSTYLSHIQTDRNLTIIIGRYEAIMKRIKSLKESYLVEMALIRDRKERIEYENKFQLITKRIEEISEKIERMIQIRQKQLPQLASDLELQPMQTQILNETKSLQDQTKSSIARSSALVNHSTFVASSTLETLHEQHQQIDAVGAHVTKIDSQMDHAKSLVTEYIQLLASDRIFQFFSVLNMFLLAVIVIYVFSTGKKK